MNKQEKHEINVKKDITQLIEKYNDFKVEINDKTDLFTDIGIDSLSLIMLLGEIEGKFNIHFNLFEIANCSKVCNLINMIETKIKE